MGKSCVKCKYNAQGRIQCIKCDDYYSKFEKKEVKEMVKIEYEEVTKPIKSIEIKSIYDTYVKFKTFNDSNREKLLDITIHGQRDALIDKQTALEMVEALTQLVKQL